MKKRLRTELQGKRNTLSSCDLQEKSDSIYKRLLTLNEFKQVQSILYYVSCGNEVSTHEMIKKSLLIGKQVAVPCTDTKNRTLNISELRNWDDLTPCAYNILEPKKDCRHPITLHEIDIIIVPGIGFDLQGNRIGHGKGYYDSLLRDAIDKPKIGLAFEVQIVNQIPVQKHDVKVDKIVTEKRIITCKPLR